MKKLGFLFLLVASAFGQSTAGPFVISSGTSACATIDVSGQSAVGISVTGTFSATLQPEVAIQGQAATNIQVTPSTSSTAQSTITAAGNYTASVGGYNTFLICVTAYTSGTATIRLNTVKTTASNGGTGGGGGGSASPLTTKGDIFTFTTVNARFGVGSNGQCLTAQSGQATGLLWAACGGAQAFNTITSGTNASATMAFSGTGTIAPALPDGSLGTSSLYWSSDGAGQGFYNAGGVNQVKKWGDNGGSGSDIWGWTGQDNSDAGLFAPDGGVVYIGWGNSATGVCVFCFRETSSGTGSFAGAVTLATHTASQFIQGTPCVSSGGTCGAASSGWVTIAAGATTVTVATTAYKTNNSCSVTGNCSNVSIQEDATKSTPLSVTCNTTVARTYAVSAGTNATSFVITASAAPVANPACLSFKLN